MIAADIFRGRYRESLGKSKTDHAGHAAAISLRPADGEPRFPARASHHGPDPVELVPALRPQSANLRTQIFRAKPSDYRKATQRIYHAPDQASFIDLPLVAAP